ncbi:MAG: hypothetical protein HY916_04485 [Desulfovibrio sp.]|nr:hypothetical protein [Desulfovibrio sp.]
MAWASYRQASRNAPEPAAFPLAVGWPVAPGEDARAMPDIVMTTPRRVRPAYRPTPRPARSHGLFAGPARRAGGRNAGDGEQRQPWFKGTPVMMHPPPRL